MLFCVLIFVIIANIAMIESMKPPVTSSYYVKIKTTWNNESLSSNEHVSLTLNYCGDDLMILIQSPFYNDPVLPDWSKKPATFEKLYNYEVVELFLLNSLNNNYLEIELSPRGQYLLLELNGYRNVTRQGITLKSYNVRLNEQTNRWSCRAIVSNENLPKGIDKFNAYAIHGSGDQRKYLALFPAPNNHNDYKQPDFHRLELFQPIPLFHPFSDEDKKTCCCSNNSNF